MNSIHDLGGMDGFGPVRPDVDERPFHAAWEGRVLAMQRAMSFTGVWIIDEFRASIEAMDPIEYLTYSYYKKWLIGLERGLESRGLVTADEVAAARSLREDKVLPRTLSPADVPTLKRGDFARPPTAQPQFTAGDRVRTRNLNPATHTRLPRYARGKTGIVEINRGCHVYPDSVAIGGGENPQWLYTVVFSAHELWGADGDPETTISIEAFEPYLTRA